MLEGATISGLKRDDRRARFATGIAMSVANRADFGRQPTAGRHELHHSELFTDAALIDLLDHMPRAQVHALTMGSDLTRPQDNRLALHDGVSGADMLRAVRGGRLWLNITRVDRADARYRRLVDQMYGELAAVVGGFAPDSSQATLLVSSPHALVYYHVDGPATVLWHLRGHKRVWVYPALDERYATREALEGIFAGVQHEYLPFDPSFDAGAAVFDLEPGQWLAWAQNAPHRVSNLDSLNVSLSTEHFTPDSRRRARVYAANRYLRVRWGLANLSARESGAGAMMKAVVHRLARLAGVDPAQTKRHVATLRVDPDAPHGVTPLDPQTTPARALA